MSEQIGRSTVSLPEGQPLRAEHIRAWRDAHGASQRQAAGSIGVCARTWYAWEHGGRVPAWLRPALQGASKDLRRLVVRERARQRRNLRRIRKRELGRRQREARAQQRLARLTAAQESRAAAQGLNREVRDLEHRLRENLLLEEEVARLGQLRRQAVARAMEASRVVA